MNVSSVKNVSCVSISNSNLNTNTAFIYGVRFFAYSVFYYFFRKKTAQRIGNVSV